MSYTKELIKILSIEDLYLRLNQFSKVNIQFSWGTTNNNRMIKFYSDGTPFYYLIGKESQCMSYLDTLVANNPTIIGFILDREILKRKRKMLHWWMYDLKRPLIMITAQNFYIVKIKKGEFYTYTFPVKSTLVQDLEAIHKELIVDY